MAVKRNQRTLPLTLKSAADYPLNAALVAAFDYAAGDGAPHVGTYGLAHDGAPTLVSLLDGEIMARDPSQGKTVITPYKGLNVGKLGFGTEDGLGGFTVHRRYRAPSAYSGTSSNRQIALYRDKASGFSLHMVESISNPWCFFYATVGNVSVPPAGQRDVNAAFRIPYGSIVDLHLVRDGNFAKFFLNGVLISTVDVTGFVLTNTEWTGLPTQDGIAGGNPNDLLLIDHSIWKRSFTDSEVAQHRAEPYAGYVNTAAAATKPAAPTSIVATAGQEQVSVTGTPGSNGGSPVIEYTARIYAVSSNALLAFETAQALPVVVAGVPVVPVYAKLTATNSVGASDESSASNQVTPTAAPVKPSAPTAPVATPGPNSVSVSATPGAAGSSPITSYTAKIYAADDNALLGTKSAPALPINVTGIPVELVYAKVFATSAAGDGPESAASASVTPTDASAVPVRFDFPTSYKIAAPVVVLPPQIVSVEVVPANAELAGGATIQLSVNVQGLNNPDFGVIWSAPAGDVTQSGAFTGPAATTQEQRIRVRATSKQDPTQWDECEIVIAALVVEVPLVDSVEITPALANVEGGGRILFTAKVNGPNNPSQAGTWAVDLGSVFEDGAVVAPQSLFRPQVGTVTFTSTLDPKKKGTAQFIVEALADEVEPPAIGNAYSLARTVTVKADSLAFSAGSFWNMNNPKQPRGLKDPDSVFDISFDWKEWLKDAGNDSIARVVFDLGAGITNAGSGFNGTVATIFVAGGSVPGVVPIQCRIFTENTPQRVEDRTVYLIIEER